MAAPALLPRYLSRFMLASILAVANRATPRLAAQSAGAAGREDPSGAEAGPFAAAEAALEAPIVTIVQKPHPSPTGDAHDYVSYARYYWPDPAKPNGLPYLRNDGHSNEVQVALGDEPRLFKMTDAIRDLALGWSTLHREDCARRAGDWLRAWFVDPETRMNPNLDHAQIRLGHDHDLGSNAGILDARSLIDVVDALQRLRGSPALGPAEGATVDHWFQDYLNWLLTSVNGRAEHAAENNHGTWFLVQAVALARFTGQEGIARQLCAEDPLRIRRQIEPDGSQPKELVRADGLGYSIFNLQAQLALARLARPLGFDLIHYQAPNGGSLMRAIDYLRPYNGAVKAWPGHQFRKVDPRFLDPILRDAAKLNAG
jgi:hypothetical protein